MECQMTTRLCKKARAKQSQCVKEGTKNQEIQIDSPVTLLQNGSSEIPADKIHSGRLKLRWNTHLHYASLTKLRLEVLTASEALQLSIHHDADASAQRVSLFHAVRSQNNGARLHRLRYNAPHEAAAGWIHAGRRLI
jgi:hypothetical protein